MNHFMECYKMIVKSPLQLNIQLQSKRKLNQMRLNKMTIPCSNNDEYIHSHSSQKYISKFILFYSNNLKI